MKKTRIIAAAFAAVMMMTTTAAISASAESTKIKPEDFVCTLNVPQEKVPSLFEQIQKWIDQITQKKNEPQKKRLIQMHEFEIERMVKRDYNMTITQYYEVVSSVANTYIYSLYIEQLEIQIRNGMEREARYNCIPTWNEDMIRFMKDYWDELREAAWDWLETNKNN